MYTDTPHKIKVMREVTEKFIELHKEASKLNRIEVERYQKEQAKVWNLCHVIACELGEKFNAILQNQKQYGKRIFYVHGTLYPKYLQAIEILIAEYEKERGVKITTPRIVHHELVCFSVDKTVKRPIQHKVENDEIVNRHEDSSWVNIGVDRFVIGTYVEGEYKPKEELSFTPYNWTVEKAKQVLFEQKLEELRELQKNMHGQRQFVGGKYISLY